MHPNNKVAFFFFAARAHSWLMFNLDTISIHRPFSSKLLSSWVAPSVYWCKGLLVPTFNISQQCALTAKKKGNISLGWIRVLPAGQEKNINTSREGVGSSINHWDTLLVTGLELDFVPQITTLRAQLFTQFSIPLIARSCSSHFSSSVSISGEASLKSRYTVSTALKCTRIMISSHILLLFIYTSIFPMCCG